MHFSFLKACLLALATSSSVLAQSPTSGFNVFTYPFTPGLTFTAGETMHIKWTSSQPARKINILLLEGLSNTTLQIDSTPVASSIDSSSGSYDWPIPTSLKSFPLYGFKLELVSDPNTFQYSTFFSIRGLGSTTSSTVGETSTKTVIVSKVSDTTSVSVTSSSASSTSSAAVTTAPIYGNTTITSVTSTAAGTGAGTGKQTTVTTASVSQTPNGAMATAAVGGTGLVGALLLGLGMML